VSPVENDIHPAFRITTSAKPTTRKAIASGIPVARKAAPITITPTRAYKRDLSKPTKWDKDSGEPTTSERGIPHKVKPGTVVQGLEKIKLRSVTAPVSSSQYETVSEKPAWKGASGRAPLVSPVTDTIQTAKQTSTPIVQPTPRRGINNPSPILTSPLYHDRDSVRASGIISSHLEESKSSASKSKNRGLVYGRFAYNSVITNAIILRLH